MIKRDPIKAAKEKYDLIIIGGGIYGVMLSYEASRRGLSSLLVEKGDFGGQTSFNSLKIIHGGLRYLQKLDVHRFRESVQERSWFLKNFPDLIQPLPCLMPLYGDGVHRPSILRAALMVNDLLSFRRNRGLPASNQIKSGGVIDPNEVKKRFPMVFTDGLKGAAVWYDGFMADSPLLLMTILRQACENGAISLNYFEACSLLTSNNEVTGIHAIDRVNGQKVKFSSKVVLNAAGPWCRETAALFDRDLPILFKKSLAWNVLFNRDLLSDHALALKPRKSDAQIYFIVPWKGKLLAGTGHAGCDNNTEKNLPSEKQLQDFLSDLNMAVPELNLDYADIAHVFSGFLPARKAGAAELAVREVIIDHSAHTGPKGLYSVSGVKFTTSRLVAEKTLTRVFNTKPFRNETDVLLASGLKKEDGIHRSRGFDLRSVKNVSEFQSILKKIVDEEAVVYPEDLINRRTNLWMEHDLIAKYSKYIYEFFNMEKAEGSMELLRSISETHNRHWIDDD